MASMKFDLPLGQTTNHIFLVGLLDKKFEFIFNLPDPFGPMTAVNRFNGPIDVKPL